MLIKPFAAILLLVTPTADKPDAKIPPQTEETDPYWRRDCYINEIPRALVCRLPGGIKGKTHPV